MFPSLEKECSFIKHINLFFFKQSEYAGEFKEEICNVITWRKYRWLLYKLPLRCGILCITSVRNWIDYRENTIIEKL